MGNTDAHLKNWALRYPDGRTPELAPLYDPVCVTAFFEGVPPAQYAVNRANDKALRSFGWADLEKLLEDARMLRVGRYLSLAREVVRQAQADWPALLTEAPSTMRRAVTERLQGGVALTA